MQGAEEREGALIAVSWWSMVKTA